MTSTRRATRVLRLVLCAGITFAACARPTPEQQIVNDAARALGGSDRILGVKTLVLEGQGTSWNPGQDMTPEATGQTFTLTSYRRALDVAAGRMRVEQTRTPNFTYFQGQQPQKQVFGLDGEVGYNVPATGDPTRVSNAAAKDRRADFYHHPLTIVRAALDPSVTLSNPRTADGQQVIEVATPAGSFTLAIDQTTKLPSRVVSMTDNVNLGDVAIETAFGDYQEVSGLTLPARLATKMDKWNTIEIRVASQSVDTDTGDLTAPSTARAAAPIEGPPPANVTAEPLARGIWLLAGQSHHSVLVEFSDQAMLIEAPQHDTRALAVIAKAKEVVPNKQLTKLVTTHHHFDHTGGLRAAIADGLTIVTHKASAAYYQETAGRAHSIVPDALARNAKPVSIETVDEELVVKDAAMTMSLYHIAGSPHADTLLMAYFPRERLLVEADVYSPASAVHPFAANLLENITRRKLRVDRVVPLHGTVVPYGELVKTQAIASK
jgi:glyoxylase-like metal-dependent hydrolase (beta-lactamase superfamily II)